MKVKRLPVSSELVFGLMRGQHPGYRVTKNELPQDAQLLNVQLAWPHSVELLIQSESFEEVLEGSEIPLFIPEFEAIP